MPFQRPSTLARSGAPESAFESQTYWMNDVMARGAAAWDDLPTAASAARFTVTNKRVDRMIEQTAERGGLAAAARDDAVEYVGGDCDHEQNGGGGPRADPDRIRAGQCNQQTHCAERVRPGA